MKKHVDWLARLCVHFDSMGARLREDKPDRILDAIAAQVYAAQRTPMTLPDWAKARDYNRSFNAWEDIALRLLDKYQASLKGTRQ